MEGFDDDDGVCSGEDVAEDMRRIQEADHVFAIHPRERWNCWFGKQWSRGRYWSFHIWPSVEFTWVSGNRSFHVETKWLFWEFKLNTFWDR